MKKFLMIALAGVFFAGSASAAEAKKTHKDNPYLMGSQALEKAKLAANIFDLYSGAQTAGPGTTSGIEFYTKAPSADSAKLMQILKENAANSATKSDLNNATTLPKTYTAKQEINDATFKKYYERDEQDKTDNTSIVYKLKSIKAK